MKAFALLPEAGGGFDFILADLGVSSMQIDDPARGFTFKADGPLYLRLNPTRPPSAADWLAKVSEADLAAVLAENADEPKAALLAHELVARRAATPFTRTRQLADAIRDILRLPKPVRGEEADDTVVRRVFQALRIAVNGELDQLVEGLFAAEDDGIVRCQWCRSAPNTVTACLKPWKLPQKLSTSSK